MWFAVPEQPVFAAAGFWQHTQEGRGFTMVTCDANELVAPIHPRAMIAILHDAYLALSVKDQPIAAWAGLWRVSDEWGRVYSGLITNCNGAIRPVHDRMPVPFHHDEYDQWLHGGLDDLIGFKERCFPDDLIVMERTTEPRRTRQPDPVETPPLL